MGELTVIFRGIVTHFKELVIGPDLVAHRAVLVNASGENVINTIRIPPHFARIHLPDQSEGVLLQGVSLTISPGIGQLVYEPSYDATLPSLAQQMSQIEPLGPFDESLVVGETWPAVAAHFTVMSGTFSGCKKLGAAEARLVIEFDEDVVTLNASAFPGAPPLPFDTVQQFKLPSTIRIHNLAEGMQQMEDPRSHFFLHYLLAQNFPGAPQAPLTIGGPDCDPFVETVDAGCSDSNYP